jgi:hypothetical protein
MPWTESGDCCMFKNLKDSKGARSSHASRPEMGESAVKISKVAQHSCQKLIRMFIAT